METSQGTGVRVPGLPAPDSAAGHAVPLKKGSHQRKAVAAVGLSEGMAWGPRLGTGQQNMWTIPERIEEGLLGLGLTALAWWEWAPGYQHQR